MTVNLQVLTVKSEVKVAMRYKSFMAVAMRCKNKGKPKDVRKDCVILQIFLSRYLFLHKFFLQMFINFSKRHKLHLLLTLL